MHTELLGKNGTNNQYVETGHQGKKWVRDLKNARYLVTNSIWSYKNQIKIFYIFIKIKIIYVLISQHINWLLQGSSTSFSISFPLPYEVISWPLKLFSRFIQNFAARVPSHLAEGTEQSPQQLHCFLQRTWLPLSLYFLALGNDRLQNQMLHRSLDNNLERWPLLAYLFC